MKTEREKIKIPDPELQLTQEWSKEALEAFMGVTLTNIESVGLKKIVIDTYAAGEINNEKVSSGYSRFLPLVEAQIIFLKNFYGIGPEQLSFLKNLNKEQRSEYFKKEQEKVHNEQ